MSGRAYTPRRAGARWREGAPEWVLDCFDHPQFADRFTVMFTGSCLEGDGTFAGTWLHYLSHGPNCGGSGDFSAYQCAAYRYANKHRRIRWLDLPEWFRAMALDYATPEGETT